MFFFPNSEIQCSLTLLPLPDRSNLVEVNAENENVPKEMSNYTFLVDGNGEPDTALIEKLAYLEQNSSRYGECDPEESNQQEVSNCKVLNNAPAYFNAGLVRVNAKLGVHHLMSTRNNNFSNRSQKSTIIVLAALVKLAVGSGDAADQDTIILAATFGTLGALGTGSGSGASNCGEARLVQTDPGLNRGR